MVNLIFLLAALVLFTIGYRLVKRGSPFSRVGGDAYAQKRRRKTMGQLLLVAAGLLLVTAFFNFIFGGGLPAAPDASPAAGTPQVYRAPILPPNPSDVSRAQTAFGLVTAKGENAANESLAFDTAGNSPHIDTPPSTWAPMPSGNAPDSSLVSPSAEAAENAKAEASNLTPVADGPAQKELDADWATANDAVQKDPSNPIGYVVRGNIYAKQKKYDLAKQDYQHALAIRDKFAPALFNLAELDFMQARYEAARAEYSTVIQDPDLGDLAKYSVFLCDLAGGHEDVAGKELDAFNQVGSEASYYFANVAWLLHQRKKDDAHGWLDSAAHIFSADKVGRYTSPLVYLGYLSAAESAALTN